ncbi:MAG: hypothetical protein ACOYKE_03540 [Ferruginibacter sp.]
MLNHWQNKLQHHSVPPPEGLWESIADDLDKNSFTQLQQYEAVAPENIWEQIESRLNQSNDIAPHSDITIPQKNRRLYFRIAVAAGMFTLLGLSLFWLLQSPKTSTPYVAQTKPTIDQPKSAIQLNQQPSNTTDNTLDLQSTKIKKVGLEANNIIPATSPHVIDFVAEETIIALSADPSEKTPALLTDPTIQQPADFGRTETPGTYIQITGPDGSVVRVSSKFSSIIGLLNSDSKSEEYLDIIIRESGTWKQKLKHWKEKMLNAEITSTPQNFMNIVELSNVVQE